MMKRTVLIAVALGSAALASCGGTKSGNNASGNAAGAETAANQIPAAYHGKFRDEASACAKAVTDAGVVGQDVTATQVVTGSATFTVTGVEDRGERGILISASRDNRGGAAPTPDTLDFSLSPDGKTLRWTIGGSATPVTRCP